MSRTTRFVVGLFLVIAWLTSTRGQLEPRHAALAPRHTPLVLRVATTRLTALPKSIGAHPFEVRQVYERQWAMPAIDLAAAHARATGGGITVAVIDTGVQVDHPDLASHIVPGYDVLNHTTMVTDPPGGSVSGHGTFVSGLIDLVAPAASIMPVRVLDASGEGQDGDVATGIDFAVDHGANILNLSMGSYSRSATVEQAVQYAVQRGALVVASSGNDNSGTPEYPAATPGVVAVAATDDNDRKAAFSNYGRYVDVSAPGVALSSTFDNGGYAEGDGTSFSAALVSGVAALAWSIHPSESAQEVISTLRESSIDIRDLNPNYEDLLGKGRIDAQGAVKRSGGN